MPSCALSNPQLSAIEGNATEPSCQPTSSTGFKDPMLCSFESNFDCRMAELAERPVNTPARIPDPVGRNLNGGAFDGNDLVSAAPIGKLEFQCSEACEKRFVMFDHSGSRRRIIFHPALLQEFSFSELSNPLRAMDDMMGSFQGPSVQAVDQVKETPSQGDHNLWSTKLLAFRETMVAAFAAFQKMQGQGLGCLANMGAEWPSVFSHATRPEHKDGSTSQPGGDFHSLMHENTEDIDALLSSDEELSSTGHSPSVLMLADTAYSCDSSTNCNKPAGRRHRTDAAADETEVNSHFSVSELGNLLEEHGCKRCVDVAPQSTASWESPAPSCCSGSVVQSSSYKARTPRGSSLKSRSKRNHSYRSSHQQLGSARRSRKDKINHSGNTEDHYHIWK